MRRRVPLALLAGLLLASPTFAALSLDLGSGTATVSGATGGGQVALFSVFREWVKEAGTRVTRIDETLTADAAGTVAYEVGREIPVSSIWIAVDVESGELAVAVPPGYRLPEIAPGAARVTKAQGRFAVDRDDLDLLVVRPGVGSWTLTVRDGGPDDADGAQDGRVVADLARAHGRPEGPPAPAAGFSGRDVLAAIDARTMEVVTREVAP